MLKDSLKRKLKNIRRDIIDLHQLPPIKLIFLSTENASIDAIADTDNHTIVFYYKKARSEKWWYLLLFHELAHLYCKHNNIYPRYYVPGGKGCNEPRYAFKAEHRTDIEARKLWDQMKMRKKYGQYVYSYPKRNLKPAMRFLKEFYRNRLHS